MQCLYSQTDTIKGKIISSVSKFSPHETVFIFEKGTSNGTIANSNGIFTLIPLQQLKTYNLEIKAEGYPTLDYQYQSSWCSRERPKSIVINAKCTINRKKAKQDFKSQTMKLYLGGGIAPVTLSPKDKNFEKEFKITYVQLGCESTIYECTAEYNHFIIRILTIKYGEKWQKTKRNDIVGLNSYVDSSKPCLD